MWNKEKRIALRDRLTPVRALVVTGKARDRQGTVKQDQDERTIRYLCAGRGGTCRRWLGSGPLDVIGQEIVVADVIIPPDGMHFYGFADSGFRLSRGGSRRRKFNISGLVPVGGRQDTDRGGSRLLGSDKIIYFDRPVPVRGTRVVVPGPIFCYACGALNEVIRPDAADLVALFGWTTS
jgi:hypothetical protein